MRNIKLKLIIAHLIGTVLVILSAKSFSLLYEISFHMADRKMGESIYSLYFIMNTFTFVGLFISFILSIITIKSKKFVINTLIVIFLVFLFDRFLINNKLFLETISVLPNNFNIINPFLIISGIILLATGLAVFFKEKIKLF